MNSNLDSHSTSTLSCSPPCQSTTTNPSFLSTNPSVLSLFSHPDFYDSLSSSHPFDTPGYFRQNPQLHAEALLYLASPIPSPLAVTPKQMNKYHYYSLSIMECQSTYLLTRSLLFPTPATPNADLLREIFKPLFVAEEMDDDVCSFIKRGIQCLVGRDEKTDTGFLTWVYEEDEVVEGLIWHCYNEDVREALEMVVNVKKGREVEVRGEGEGEWGVAGNGEMVDRIMEMFERSMRDISLKGEKDSQEEIYKKVRWEYKKEDEREIEMRVLAQEAEVLRSRRFANLSVYFVNTIANYETIEEGMEMLEQIVDSETFLPFLFSHLRHPITPTFTLTPFFVSLNIVSEMLKSSYFSESFVQLVRYHIPFILPLGFYSRTPIHFTYALSQVLVLFTRFIVYQQEALYQEVVYRSSFFDLLFVLIFTEESDGDHRKAREKVKGELRKEHRRKVADMFWGWLAEEMDVKILWSGSTWDEWEDRMIVSVKKTIEEEDRECLVNRKYHLRNQLLQYQLRQKVFGDPPVSVVSSFGVTRNHRQSITRVVDLVAEKYQRNGYPFEQSDVMRSQAGSERKRRSYQKERQEGKLQKEKEIEMYDKEQVSKKKHEEQTSSNTNKIYKTNLIFPQISLQKQPKMILSLWQQLAQQIQKQSHKIQSQQKDIEETQKHLQKLTLKSPFDNDLGVPQESVTLKMPYAITQLSNLPSYHDDASDYQVPEEVLKILDMSTGKPKGEGEGGGKRVSIVPVVLGECDPIPLRSEEEMRRVKEKREKSRMEMRSARREKEEGQKRERNR